MSRHGVRRSHDSHRVVAEGVLARFEEVTGSRAELPIPIELIIERVYGLSIEWSALHEPEGQMILGALYPEEKTIRMNERHIGLFDSVIGPERFTYAHELGHWLYDVGSPDQMRLDFQTRQQVVFCRSAGDGSPPIRPLDRETAANRFAAALLLPERMLRPIGPDEITADLARTASQWGVSRQMLEIRLTELGWAAGSNHGGPGMFDKYQ